MPETNLGKRATTGVALMRHLPLPKYWEVKAEIFAVNQFDFLTEKQQLALIQKANELVPLRQIKIDHYVGQTFRESFFRIIGHHFVVQLLLNAPRSRGRGISIEEWSSMLGVNRSTIHRWKTSEVAASAEIFFVIQLLVLNLPLRELTLPDNDEMLLECLLGVMRALRETMKGKSKSILTSTIVRAIFHLMRFIHALPSSQVSPMTPDDLITAIKQTVKHLRSSDESTFGGMTPSQLRSWFDDWGLAYSVVAYCYQPDWKGARIEP